MLGDIEQASANEASAKSDENGKLESSKTDQPVAAESTEQKAAAVQSPKVESGASMEKKPSEVLTKASSTTTMDPENLTPLTSFGAKRTNSTRMSSRRINLKPQLPMLSESAENETLYVRPVLRSERNVFSSRASRDSSEIRPAGVRTDEEGRDTGVAEGKRGWCHCISELEPGTKKYQAYLTYLTLGVIYGDIGTSPLYTLSAMFPNPPSSPEAVIGGVSLMLWSLIIIVFLKYICFVLLADDYGEGGTFALFALLSRGLRQGIKSDKLYRRVNFIFSIIAIIGVAAILADGVLTPAISVMGAIAGLNYVSSAVDQGVTAGVSCAILFLFFLPQRFGTSRVSFIFSPIIILWYCTLFGIGIYNICKYPTILTAFNPYEAIKFLGGQYPGFGGWASLGSAFLTVTGSEAMYADVGHFNPRAVRTSAVMVVLPALMICYCGQGAALALNPSVNTNVFYLTLPDGTLYYMLILSVLASIVASQAMVSATFSIVAQAIRLQYLPRLTVKHTDRREYGQVYVPEVNYFLMIMVIIVIAGYRDVTALGYAYGVTVSLAFFVTSLMYSFVIYFNFKRSPFWGVLFFVVFGVIDANFLAANLTKFVTGGWFSVAMTCIISAILMTWRAGRSAMTEEQKKMNRTVGELYAPREEMDDTGSVKQVIYPLEVSTPLLICFSSTTDAIPAFFYHFSRRFPVRPKNLVFVTISAVNVAFVEVDPKFYPVEGHTNVYRLVVYHGYSERPPSAHKIAAFLIRQLDCFPEASRYFPPPTDAELVRFVDPTFVIGRDRVVPKPQSSIFRTLVVEMFQVLFFFSKPVAALLSVPPDNALEVGLQVPI